MTRYAKYTILKLQSKLCNSRKGGSGYQDTYPRAEKGEKALPGRTGAGGGTITSIEVGRYTASLPLAYKIAHYFDLTIEEVFDFSELEGEVRRGRV